MADPYYFQFLDGRRARNRHFGDSREAGSMEDRRTSGAARNLSIMAVVVTALCLLATAAFVYAEHWLTPAPRWFQKDQTVFVAGSIGTEFIPLPVLEVLPEIDPEGFPPPQLDGKTKAFKGGWIEKYGFLERRGPDEPTVPSTEPELSELLRSDATQASLPVGFSLSHFRPFSPDPSPVTFVGVTCAGCHSIRLPDRGPDSKLVYGAGNTGLDLIGFFEAFRAVLLAKKPKPSVPLERTKPRSITEAADLSPEDLEYQLSLSSIKEARKKLGLSELSLAEDAMIYTWLTGAQQAVETTKMRDDLPATPEQLRTPEYNKVGPGRTEPFVTLDHEVLRLPALHNFGYSKIPCVFREGDRPWAQFDGSVKHPRTRSGLAAMTVGGSVDNLGGMGIARNIIAAAEFTLTLRGPTWQEIFGSTAPASSGTSMTSRSSSADDIESSRLSELGLKGREVYRKHCSSCHGQPDPAKPESWALSGTASPDFGKIVPAINPFGFPREEWPKEWLVFPSVTEWKKQATDPHRVDFRDAKIMPYTLFTYFDRSHPQKVTGEYYPLDHPLATERENIRNSGGYINAPIDSAFARAPYLHNGSIPTLTQLINLEPRPARFLRGFNSYDPKKVGLVAPQTAEEKQKNELFWMFDVTVSGNLNKGHNYPWAFDDPAKDEEKLRQLLEYLKTL
jgi:mono/diheme cytochrome c family protein